jgi:hypothetical protein
MPILINNVPCKYINKFTNKIDFILLHKILDNDKYRRYFINSLNINKYKILDNGAYELGDSLDDKILIEWAKKLKVNEVVAPDTFGKKDNTIKKLQQFLKQCPTNIKIQAVPQGKENSAPPR